MECCALDVVGSMYIIANVTKVLGILPLDPITSFGVEVRMEQSSIRPESLREATKCQRKLNSSHFVGEAPEQPHTHGVIFREAIEVET